MRWDLFSMKILHEDLILNRWLRVKEIKYHIEAQGTLQFRTFACSFYLYPSISWVQVLTPCLFHLLKKKYPEGLMRKRYKRLKWVSFVGWLVQPSRHSEGAWISCGKLLLHIKRSQLRWFGHLIRCLPVTFLQGAFWTCPIVRTPGKPRADWRNYLSHLALKCLRIAQRGWRVTGVRNVWNSLLDQATRLMISGRWNCCLVRMT